MKEKDVKRFTLPPGYTRRVSLGSFRILTIPSSLLMACIAIVMPFFLLILFVPFSNGPLYNTKYILAPILSFLLSKFSPVSSTLNLNAHFFSVANSN